MDKSGSYYMVQGSRFTYLLFVRLVHVRKWREEQIPFVASI